MKLILQTKNLSIGYKDQPILSGLNIELYTGDILQIKGDNGSGKTTLIKTLMGEIPFLQGNIQRRLKNFYYLSQQYNQLTHIPYTVKDLLEDDCNHLNFSTSLEWNKLSGGQKQQVLIHRAFNQKHDLLILDEPFNHLDRNSIKDITNLLNTELEKNKKQSLIIISHIELSLNKEIRFINI